MTGAETPVDVVVLGGGAAGLMAAIRAAELGSRTALFEKNRRAGVKILISGGTRCNITNARGLRRLDAISGTIDPAYDLKQARGTASIVQAFGPNGTFLRPALRGFDVEQTVRFFEQEGVATKVEANGKVFPMSDRAIDVLNALLHRLERSRARLLTNAAVTGLACDTVAGEYVFHVKQAGGPMYARAVVLAMGGQSYPGCGTTGEGYSIARSFGHSIIEPKPALVPLLVMADWVRSLSGVTLPDVVAAIVDATGRVLSSRREALLFTHKGVSGPAVLDVSREVARHERPQSLVLKLDLWPDTTFDELDAALAAAARVGRPNVLSLLPARIPRRLAEALLMQCGVPADRIGPEWSRAERRRLIQALKALALPIAGTLGFEKAEVTSGGIALGEVNPETLESRVQPGLFLAGEVLDLDGRIGGYNFQAAWSTGWLAGESAARRVTGRGARDRP